MQRITQQHLDEYFGDGLTILQAAIPPSLLTELRLEADKARDITRREKTGAMRLQPYRYEQLDHRPFREFGVLDMVQEAVHTILGEGYPQSDIMGILMEPADQACCTIWHRDWFGTEQD